MITKRKQHVCRLRRKLKQHVAVEENQEEQVVLVVVPVVRRDAEVLDQAVAVVHADQVVDVNSPSRIIICMDLLYNGVNPTSMKWPMVTRNLKWKLYNL